tara:strand:- start:11158 stop:11733 length:576 start_codon:yes stop_codon:yes gene_type:complete
MYMSITTRQHELKSETIVCAVSWTALPNLDAAHPAGSVCVGVNPNADLIFVLSVAPLSGPFIIAHQSVALPARRALMRIDEVCFPVGAIAHRHTHSGAGFRHLVRGALGIEAQDSTRTMTVGDSWFEPAQTPVRAVALQDTGVTSFVRCMIVPAAFDGQSTFQLVDAADAGLPRLQVTHRHIDHAIYVEAG